jgi:hypothetical protein
VSGSGWAYVKGYLTAPLLLARLEVLEDGHLRDKSEGKSAEVIGASFGSRHHQELQVRV